MSEIKLDIEVKNDEMFCRVLPLNIACTYAFYLKKRDNRVAVRWYTSEPKVVFKINSPGVYTVVCFVQINDEKTIVESNPIYIELSTSIASDIIAEVIEKEKKK